MAGRVLVVGGGIAGPVTALALHRAGIEAEVHEAHDGPADTVLDHEGGGLLSLAANGMRALRVAGAMEAVQASGVAVPEMEMWTAGGHPVGRAPRHGSHLSDVPSWTVLRGPFVRALREVAADHGIPVHTGHRLVAATGGPGEVTARFDDGTEATGAVLVGADGVHSATRRLIDPAAPEPEYAGVHVLGGTAEGLELPVTANTFHAFMTRPGLFAFVCAGPGRYWWTAQVAAPQRPTRDELRALASAAGRDQLAAGYRSHPAALIGATTRFHPPTVLHRMPAVPTWRRAGMVLVGDAAHPVDAGIGGSLAVEDAVVLATCLRDVADPAAALERFEQLRRPRIDPMVRFGARHKKSKTPGRLRQGVTLGTLTVLGPLLLRLTRARFANRMYDFDVDWDAPVSAGAER
jgi:2-polyprenyl-6-methoxyphenol hydroxylase-like FAD-dependent oxidoreductase